MLVQSSAHSSPDLQPHGRFFLVKLSDFLCSQVFRRFFSSEEELVDHQDDVEVSGVLRMFSFCLYEQF